ncbi:unnamed protein product [marine sediment metagenome]|uniref:Uncharacterized protein n=1 Tax=marine sediment metagenome TaxID=412755 RepID=X0TB83_9ZZZZ
MTLYCIPMKREKLRRILARELYHDEMEDMKTTLGRHPLGLSPTPEWLEQAAYNQYLAEYYPGRYPPYEDK